MATDPTSTSVPIPAAPGADEGFLHSVATSMGIDPDALKTAVRVIGTDPVGAAKAVGSEAVDELNEMVHNPVQTATTTGQGMLAAVTNPDAKATAMRHLKSPGLNQKIQGLNEYAASIIPFVGGNIVKSQEQAAQGNLAGSLGTVVGTTLPMVTDSEPVQALKTHLAETGAQFVQGAKESLQRAASATAPEGSLEAGFAKIGGKKVKDGAPKPNYAYRARPVGQEGIGTESHAQATASSEEAQRYASDLENSTGQPHEVVKVDLNKVPAENYTRKEGPNGNDWVKFHEPVDESVVEKSGLKPDFSALGSKTVKDAEPSLPEKTPFEGRHFSRVERDDNILGGERGAAAAGEEKDRLQHDNKVPGVYAYREGATPEPQIGSRAYQYEIKGNKAIADISEGGNGHELLQGTVTKKQAEYEAAGDNATIAFQKALNDGEAALRDAGYDGYERGDGSVFLFGDQKPTGKFVNHIGAAVRVPLNEPDQVSVHEKTGGSTFTPNGENLAGKDLYAVGAYPDRTMQVDKLTPKILAKFKSDNADLLAKGDHAVGTWRDSETGKSVLDITKTYPTREEGIAAGQAANQKAIYHLGGEGEISTGGQGDYKNTTLASPADYQAALERNPSTTSLIRNHGESMTPEQIADEMKDRHLIQWVKDGKPQDAFVGVKADGTISRVVNNAKDAVGSLDLIRAAIARGGNKIDAWDIGGKLPKIYEKLGFKTDRTVPYDTKAYGKPSEALKEHWQRFGWKESDAYPGVTYMSIPESPLTPSTGGTPEAPAAPPAPKESESLPLVSSRVPSKTVKGETIADHTNSALTSDMQAATAAPGFLQKLADRVGPTPGFKDPGGDATARTNAYIRHIADNVKFVWDKLKPEDIKKDEQWYPVGAHQRGIEVAQKHGIDPHQAYAITAALSPLTDWDVNTSLAERAVDIWKNQQDTKFTPQMKAAAKEILSIPAMKKFSTQLKKLEGKTIGELPKVKDQAWWLRLYDEGHNPREYPTWNPDGTSGGLAKNMDGSPKQVSWSFQNLIENAIHIMKDGSQENISKVLGGAHKIRNFYNNQLAPNDPRFLTIDTHAVAAGQLRPMSGKTYEVRMNFGGTSNKAYGLKGTYALHDAGYRLAANELGVTIPSRLQSPTWVKIRELFPNRFKTPENQEAIDAIWKEHTNGKITADEARNKIWDYAEGWNTRNAGGTGATSDQRELFDTSVRGETSEGTTGRGNRGNAAPTNPEVEDEDTSFDFGANVKPAPKRASKVSATQKAKNDAMAKGIAGLIRSGKK